MKIIANKLKIKAEVMLLEDPVIFILKNFIMFTNCGQVNMLLNEYLKHIFSFSKLVCASGCSTVGSWSLEIYHVGNNIYEVRHDAWLRAGSNQ